MHTTSTLNFLTLTALLITLTTPVLSGPPGINCYSKDCGWSCGSESCSQTFADVLTGKYQVENGFAANPGLSDTQVIHDGQQLACMPDFIGDDGLCAFVYGLGDATTTGANVKLVAQDLANHCGECGQAPVNRVGNVLKGGWYQVQRTATKDICATPGNDLALC